MLSTGKYGRRRSAHSSEAGYTLLELLVVLAIVVLLTSAYLAMSSGIVRSGDLRAAAAQIVRDLTLARQVAAGGRPIVVAFEERSWGALEQQPRNTLPDGINFTLLDERASNGLYQVVFFPDGSVAGGPIELQAGDFHATISIDRLTGRIMTDDER